MEEQFVISRKSADDLTPVIKCKGKNLFIHVYDTKPLANKKTVVYRADYKDASNGKFSKYFLVCNGFTAYGFENWSLNLFLQMIWFYSKHMLNTDHYNVETENLLASFFYDSNAFYEPYVFDEEKDECIETSDPDQLALFAGH